MKVVVPTVSIRDLANKASAVVDEVAKSGKPAVVTKRGKPIAAVVPIDPDALDDWVLANAIPSESLMKPGMEILVLDTQDADLQIDSAL